MLTTGLDQKKKKDKPLYHFDLNVKEFTVNTPFRDDVKRTLKRNHETIIDILIFTIDFFPHVVLEL